MGNQTRGLLKTEATDAKLAGLCVPILEEFAAETTALFELYDRNVDGIDPNGVVNGNGNGETPDFLSFYQTEGVQFAFERMLAILADEMGVGKTPQGVALRYEIENRTGKRCRTLVICPNSVKEYWAQCIKAWSKKGRTGKVVYLDTYSTAALRQARNADWLIVNYDLLAVHSGSQNPNPGVTTRRRVYRWLMSQQFRLTILDEVQNAKNGSCHLSQNVVEVTQRSEYVLLLSGTPVPSWLHDIFVVMTLLEPEIFPTVQKVAEAYRQDPRIIRAFFKRRRLKRGLKEVVRLPKLRVRREWLTLEGAQEKIYKTILERYNLDGGIKLLRLKQALLDPVLVPQELLPEELRSTDFGDPVKYRALDRIIERAMRQGEKVVVFSPLARTHVIARLAKRYERFGVITQDGTIPETERRILRKRFAENPNCRICLATDVVGEGVNLSAASVGVFLDLPYAPGEYDQMVARLHRRGQTRPVTIYELLVRGTVDEGTAEFLKIKRDAIRFIEEGLRLTPAQLEAMTKPVFASGIHRRHMWTGQEYVNWYAAKMAGVGYEKNKRALERNRAEIARHYAECYTQSWETTASANSAEVCQRIVRALETRGRLRKKLDLGGAFGVLSHVLGESTVVTDINPYHFETEFYRQHIASLKNEVAIAPYHNLPKKWLRRFHLAVNALGLHQCGRDERRDAIREAWRVLKPGGYFLTTLPMGTVGGYGEAFAKAVADMGWEVVPELTGVVSSHASEGLGFQLFVLLARKGPRIQLVPAERLMLDCDDFVIRGGGKKKRLHTQLRAGKVQTLLFEGGETLEERLAQYLRRTA